MPPAPRRARRRDNPPPSPPPGAPRAGQRGALASDTSTLDATNTTTIHQRPAASAHEGSEPEFPHTHMRGESFDFRHVQVEEIEEENERLRKRALDVQDEAYIKKVFAKFDEIISWEGSMVA